MEDYFNQLASFGDGSVLVSFLEGSEASALGCVNKIWSHAIRTQRQRGKIIPIWSEDAEHRVTFRYKNRVINPGFPVHHITIRKVKINLGEKFKILEYNRLGLMNLVQDQSVYLITMRESSNGRWTEIGVESYYKNSFKHFNNLRKQIFNRERIEKERLEFIRQKEEADRKEKEAKTFLIAPGSLKKDCPWLKK
jgi:hypothetical protein